MKEIIAVIFFVVFVTGCSGGPELSVPSKTMMAIERSVAGEYDSGLEIDCDEALFSYDKREIIARGVKSIRGYNGWLRFTGNGHVANIEVVNSELHIKIPADAPYNVIVGGQEHRLPAIGKK